MGAYRRILCAAKCVKLLKNGLTAFLKWNNNITKDLKINYNVGAIFQDSKSDQTHETADGLNVTNKFSLNYGTNLSTNDQASGHQTQSAFAQASVSWKDGIFLDGSFRKAGAGRLLEPRGEFVGVGGRQVLVADLRRDLGDRARADPAVEVIVQEHLGGGADRGGVERDGHGCHRSEPPGPARMRWSADPAEHQRVQPGGGADLDAAVQRVQGTFEALGLVGVQGRAAAGPRRPRRRAGRAARPRRRPRRGPPCGRGPRRAASAAVPTASASRRLTTPDSAAVTVCVSRAVGNGASGSPPCALIMRRHTSMALPSAARRPGRRLRGPRRTASRAPG